MKRKIALITCMILLTLPLLSVKVLAADIVGNWDDFVLAFNHLKDTGGGTIKLSADITTPDGVDLTFETTAGNPITIDTEDNMFHVVSTAVSSPSAITLGTNVNIMTNENATPLMVHENGMLYVDGAEVQSSHSSYAVHTMDGGILVMQSGSITGQNCIGIDGGESTILGGTITSSGAGNVGIRAMNGAKLTVADGMISANGSSSVALAVQGNDVENGTVVTIEGGSISSQLSHGIEVTQAGRVNITSGNITGRYGIYANGNCRVDVSGGKVESTHFNGNSIYLSAQSTSHISGSTEIIGGSIGGNGIYSLGTDTIIISGGTVSGANGINLTGQSSLTVNGGTINGNGPADSSVFGCGIYASNDNAEVTITSGTINGTVSGILSGGGRLDISETVGEVIRITGNNFGINGGGSITVSGGSITATGESGSGVYVADGGSFENRGGSIRGTGSSGIGVLVGGNGSTMTACGGLMEGTDNGISIDANAGNVILYNGTIRSTTSSNPHIYLEGDIPLWVYSIIGLEENNMYWDIEDAPQNYAERESFAITVPFPQKVELTNGKQETVSFTVTGQKLDGSHVTLQDYLGTSGTLNNASYTISGNEITFIPSSVGSDNLSILDNITYNGLWSIDVNVSAAPTDIVITTTSLTDGKVGRSYTALLAADGGTKPYTWTAYGLPAGLNINMETGEIYGIPTAAGTSTVTAEVNDSASGNASKDFSLTILSPSTGVSGSSQKPYISKSNPPDGTVGIAYTHTFTAHSGRSPYNFEITDGDIPNGLQFTEDGTLSGTPKTAGTYEYTITVTDRNKKISSYTFTHVISGSVPESMPQKEIVLTVGSLQATVDGVPYMLDAEPFIDAEADRTLVPVRFISEALGAEVNWNHEMQKITIKEDIKEIILTIGSTSVLVDGQVSTIDCAPVLIPPGRTFTPLRFISENLGATVEYNDETKVIKIIL